jgi:hypothetical protein
VAVGVVQVECSHACHCLRSGCTCSHPAAAYHIKPYTLKPCAVLGELEADASNAGRVRQEVDDWLSRAFAQNVRVSSPCRLQSALMALKTLEATVSSNDK